MVKNKNKNTKRHTLVLEREQIILEIEIDGMQTHLTFIYPNRQKRATILTSDLKSMLYGLGKMFEI